MLMADLAVNVAAGLPWLPGVPGDDKTAAFRLQKAPVLWIDVDNGINRTEERISALGRTYGLPEDAPLAYISFPTPPFVAQDMDCVDLVLEAIGSTGAKLVVFDNLGTISGGADENSAQMIEVMSGLRRIAELGGCAVVVIHHKSKGTRDRAGDSLRGHSSIEAAVDLALLIEREGDDDTVTVMSTKTRDIPVAAFTALFTYENDEHKELTKARFFGTGKPEGKAFSKQKQAELCIEKDMRDGMNQSQLVELCKAAGIGRGNALAGIRNLVKSGKLIERVGTTNNALEYFRK